MPPFVTRKRQASTPPPELPAAKKTKAVHSSAVKPKSTTSSVRDKEKFLDSVAVSDESSLSDADSDDFEDVMPSAKSTVDEEEDEEDQDVDWEDALKPESSSAIAAAKPMPGGDLELTLGDRNETISYMDGKKKGPSKRDRQKRLDAHRMHVQSLMFHNSIRNAWACDKETQATLVSQLPSQIKEVVETWRRDCGDALKVRSQAGGPVSEEKGKRKSRKGKQKDQRDWGGTADRLEEGTSNLSHGDPTIRLLKYLAKYWQKQFRITAPGLRKQGHKSVRELQKEVVSFRSDKYNPDVHGEKLSSIKEFRLHAKRCEGSRDLGAQLFTALTRGLGVEARLVASLQPTGFGWNKNEEAVPRRGQHTQGLFEDDQGSDADKESQTQDVDPPSTTQRNPARSIQKRAVIGSENGSKETPIDLSSDSELSDIGSISDDSVVEMPMIAKRKVGTRKYDRDLKFPIYWTEVCSPVSHKVFPVDPILQGAPAISEEQLMAFEPRGAKAEKAKQVIAYVIAHSTDGTAKDVTTRYLKKHMWPGKTKGMRIPPEKLPIYNKRGKVKRYEEYDWFKTVMSGYVRRDLQRTPVDDMEDATDLKPAIMEKKVVKEGEESLQWYRQSAEFCLEKLLRREEALIPGAQPVKTFKSGKGDNAKEEPVFKRADVVPCKTEESWHKEGRQPKIDAVPLKYAPYRAVTTARKREIEDIARRNDGVKPLQGLYSKDQTEYIVPPPIENGIIPKNKYGNIDCFVPRMVPKGAVHLPYRGLPKVCKKLEVDYAEAVIGFEFGNKMAVPVIQGVVVAAEYQDILMDAWEEEEAKRQAREDQKRQQLVLGTWRKFLMGLRILEKMRTEYGIEDVEITKDLVNPFTNPIKAADLQGQTNRNSSPYMDMEGGFVRDDEEDEEEGDGSFSGELHIVDPRKDQQSAPQSGEFTTDTPEEPSDEVFDNAHEKTSSKLSSHDEEPTEEGPTKTSNAPSKRASSKREAQANTEQTSRRRSTRTSGQKSKYFDGSSESEVVGNMSSEDLDMGDDSDEEPGPGASHRAKLKKGKAKARTPIQGNSQGTSRTIRGRGRPRKNKV